jgi:N-acyl-D-amino-acid deacylase
MKLRILILLFVLIFGLDINGQINDNLKELDSVLTYLHQTKRFNGTVLYAENGQSIYKKAFGVADFEADEKLTTESSFNLASVSKQFFCVAIGQLADKGLLSLDDDCKKVSTRITIQWNYNKKSDESSFWDTRVF